MSSDSLLKTRSHSLFVWAFVLSLVGGYAVLAWDYPVLYMWATYEDLVGEWTQFFFFAATLIMALLVVKLPSRYRPFFVLLALACFYVMMEEISWGQRVFGFESPEVFQTKNLQGETNLHNFFTGPFATTLKHTLAYVIAAGLVGYGLVYPWALRRNIGIAQWLDQRGLAAPPWYLWPVFVSAAVLEAELIGFNEAEIAEILVGFGLLLTAVHYRFALTRHPPLGVEVSGWGSAARVRLSGRLVLLTVLVIGAAGATTYLLYQNPAHRAITADRFEDGYFKFSQRYEGYGRWDKVLEMNLLLLKRRQRDMDVYRQIATAYRQLGDEKKFNQYMNLAMELDVERLKINPQRDDVMRSLAKSYRVLGEIDRADTYIKSSEYLLVEQLRDNPTDPMLLFAMGQTQELKGELHKALEYYRLAFEGRPEFDHYKRTYMILKAELDGYNG